MDAKERLIIPLDVASIAAAEPLVAALAPHIGLFKIGLQLFHNEGPRAIELLREEGVGCFYDGKFYDIPNTVAGAVSAVTRLGVKILNVHASGGSKMMAAAAEAAETAALDAGLPRPLVFAVTVVTSLDDAALLDELGIGRPMDEQVVHLARLAQDSGLDGVVCSALEAPLVKNACGPDFQIICPGIRPQGADTHDQERVVTPAMALEAGADYIVIGRPITQAENPVAAAQNVVKELKEARQK